MAETRIKVVVRRAPTFRITADSPIPLWFCDDSDCYKTPCESAQVVDQSPQIADGRYSKEEAWDGTHTILFLNIYSGKTGKETKSLSEIGYTYDSRYKGTATVDYDRKTIHFVITDYPAVRIPDIKITADSPIPLFYRDENDVSPLPVEKSCLFDLGFAICDARYPKDECWSGTEEAEIYKDYITDYTGVVNKTINVRGYRGTVRIDFTTVPYTMHVVITDYPPTPTPEGTEKFKISEIINNNLPESIEGYACTPPHTAAYECPAGYKLTKRSFVALYGGHGCPGTDMVHRVKCEKVSEPTPKPVTITAVELRWTNGTYRASFAIGNLDPTNKYIISVRMGRHDKTVNSKTIDGVSSYDITTDIPKSEFDAAGYTLSCKVYNFTDREWETTEDYVVPPYEVKGNVDIARSTIPTTIYLEESAVFDMMVENPGDREKEYAVVLTFKNVDSGEEFKFTPENTIRVPAGGTGANRVSVVMPSASVPPEKESQSFDLVYKLEIW